jgi:hypothetical protein
MKMNHTVDQGGEEMLWGIQTGRRTPPLKEILLKGDKTLTGVSSARHIWTF